MSRKPLSIPKSAISFLVISVFFASCGASPIIKGSTTLKDKGTILGRSRDGEHFNVGKMEGKAFLLYLRSSWCPICVELEGLLGNGVYDYLETWATGFVALILIDGRMLDKEGIVSTDTGSFEGIGEENLFAGRDVPLYFAASGETTALLKLDRLPAIIGFNREGIVVGTIFGYQTDMEKKIKALIDNINSEEGGLKGESAF